jgi:hypothetical protein
MYLAWTEALNAQLILRILDLRNRLGVGSEHCTVGERCKVATSIKRVVNCRNSLLLSSNRAWRWPKGRIPNCMGHPEVKVRVSKVLPSRHLVTRSGAVKVGYARAWDISSSRLRRSEIIGERGSVVGGMQKRGSRDPDGAEFGVLTPKLTINAKSRDGD